MINKLKKANSWRSSLLLVVRFLAPLIALAAFIPARVSADGLGFTGNFYRQDFVLNQGKTSAGIDAYIIIINTDKTAVEVKVSTQAPDGVTLTVPETDFTLDPGAQRRLDVVVSVDPSAALGEYNISVSAQSYRAGSGIQVTGGGSQQAKLNIVKKAFNLPVIGGVICGLAVLICAMVWVGFKMLWFQGPRKMI